MLQRFFRWIVYILGPRCNKPLGLQNGRIRSSQLSASSSWDRNHGPNNGRLYFHQRGKSGAWCSRHNNRLQWYQVNFGRATRVVKVATQGRKDFRQWVTQYYLSFSQDGIHFAEYKQNSNRKVGESRLIFHVDCKSCSSESSNREKLVKFHLQQTKNEYTIWRHNKWNAFDFVSFSLFLFQCLRTKLYLTFCFILPISLP